MKTMQLTVGEKSIILDNALTQAINKLYNIQLKISDGLFIIDVVYVIICSMLVGMVYSMVEANNASKHG